MKSVQPFVRICASCKRMQAVDGQWAMPGPTAEPLPVALISHGICPTCISRLYPEIYRTLAKEGTR